jgi:hypothetical protein
MLNAIPEERLSARATGGFSTSNNIVRSDHEDEIEEQDEPIGHEAIDLGERRKPSIYSNKSGSSSSIEVPKRNSTVDAGKTNFHCFEKNIFHAILL